jgi:hypothetical integral membrane protein (TIGR02206 family)
LCKEFVKISKKGDVLTYLYIIPLSFAWYVVVSTFLVLLVGFVCLGRYVSAVWRDRILTFLGFYLLFDLLFMEGYLYYYDNFSVDKSLPLTFCSLMQIMASIAAIKRSRLFFEFVLFFGILGPIQAFLSPAIVYSGEEYILLDFFISHGLTIVVPIYMAACCGFAPRKGAFIKMIALMQLIVICVYAINVHIGANYMYLCSKPNVVHPLNTGPWPYYLLKWHILFYSFTFLVQGVYFLLELLDRKTTGKIY